MEFVSSDTNVWFDFACTRHIDFPFRLSYTYIMFCEAVDGEIKAPLGLREQLLQQGLQPVDITEEEFYLATEYQLKYKRISVNDSIALAIAKCRKILLLTGDGALRSAAKAEGVSVKGTIGVLDMLKDGNHITLTEYIECFQALLANIERRRLPEDEIKKRLKAALEKQALHVE